MLEVEMWESDEPQASSLTLNECDWFNAHGMRRVYGRGDKCGSRARFNMDVWRDRSDRILIRFWSRSEAVDGRSFELVGISPNKSKSLASDGVLRDDWIPAVLRRAYEEWIEEEW